MTQTDDAGRAAERAARHGYGRLVAWLAVRTGDVAGAEDALADAFASALVDWPSNGVPDRPEAWLMAAARRRQIDHVRHGATRRAAVADIIALTGDDDGAEPGARDIPDKRLELMFVCAHPAIAPEMRAPLMLQTVLGLNAARIASAFLVKPATMGQRLSRAKSKIKLAGLRFAVPEADELPGRLQDVLNAIYAAFTTGRDAPWGDTAPQTGLTTEALWLTQTLRQMMPGEGEVAGLLSLMLHSTARQPASRTAAGAYVPLDQQDTSRWSMAMIAQAETELLAARHCGPIGRYQLEAALQSAHANGRLVGQPDWRAILILHEALRVVAPSLGGEVGRAIARSHCEGPEAGLACLDDMPTSRVGSYQPYWAARAHLLAAAGRLREADRAYGRAIGLSEEEPVRAFLADRRAAALSGEGPGQQAETKADRDAGHRHTS